MTYVPETLYLVSLTTVLQNAVAMLASTHLHYTADRLNYTCTLCSSISLIWHCTLSVALNKKY